MAQSFADVVLVPDKDYGVSPDAIVSMVRAVTARLLDGLPEVDSSSWTKRAAARFVDLAEPIFSRREAVLTAEKAPVARILALCLAAEADVREIPELGNEFRLIAAGVTWLERRHKGADQPTETIVLAVMDE